MKLRSMTFTDKMHQECKTKDLGLKERRKAKRNLSSVSSTSSGGGPSGVFKSPNASLISSNKSLSEGLPNKTKSNKSNIKSPSVMGGPEVIVIPDDTPQQSVISLSRKRKSRNDSIVVVHDGKKRREDSDTVVNLCDDDVVEVDCTSTEKVSTQEDIILLDSSPKVAAESFIPLKGNKRHGTCTVTNGSSKYDSLLDMLRPISDHVVDSSMSSAFFTVDKNGWAIIKQRHRSRSEKWKHKHRRPAAAARDSERTNADNIAKPQPTSTADGTNPYGSNIYNPNPQTSQTSGALRPIVIDGSNVALGHSNGQRIFSCRGLQICVNYFAKRGHEVKAFVPQFRKSSSSVTDRHIFSELEKTGQIVYTPSRRVDGRLVVPYDDRYIVQYAAEFGGVIVSTDNFRDLLQENEAWRDTIENRLLMFTWVGDLLMFPQDPLGRHGPKLEEFLRFPP